MPRRIELELTSERPDGSWTWRAAGAREPKGELDGSILPSGAKVGDVLRAEADFDIDGITVVSVLPPKGSREEPERLEVLGPQREFQAVTSTLVGKGDRRERRDRGDRADRPRREPWGDAQRDRRPPRTPRPERSERPRRERPAPPPPKPKPKKLRAGRQHRDALLQGLSPEQVPIAEQLFRGGMPSVRQALQEQNAKAKAEGTPEVPEVTVLAIAEDLAPRVRVADWLDRAEAAAADAEEIALRDLRAVVVGADDVARDESTRELAARLRDVVDRRSAAEQQEWLQDLSSSLEGGRVVRALRLSSRPPQSGEPIPEELTTKLSDAAGAAMTAEIAPDRWATLLDAVAYSPVRRTIAPAGVPAEPGEELLALVRKHAARVPAVATLFGIKPPAPPGQKRRAPKPKPAPQHVSRPPLPPGPQGERRIPPPPGWKEQGDELAAEAPRAAAENHEPQAEPAQDRTVPAPEHDAVVPHGDVLPADAPGLATEDDEPQAEPAQDRAVPAPEHDAVVPHGEVLPADAPGLATEDDEPETAPAPERAVPAPEHAEAGSPGDVPPADAPVAEGEVREAGG